MALITVVIVTYNGAAFIHKCIQSLLNQDCPSHTCEIVVIDNASADTTVGVVRNFPTIRLLVNDKNLGFSRANNTVLEKLSSDYCILMNQDSVVDKDFIQQLVDVMEHDVCSGACGGSEHPYDRTIKNGRKTEETDWVGCGATMFRMNALKQISFFDDTYFMYNEDIDVCARLRCAGWKIYYHPEAIWHHHGWRREVDVNNVRVFHSSISRIYLLIKFGSFKQIIKSLKLYLCGSTSNKKVAASHVDASRLESSRRNTRRFKLMCRVGLAIVPKILCALIERRKVRRLSKFDQGMVDALIETTDAQIYG